MLVGRSLNDGFAFIIRNPVSKKIYSVNSPRLYQFGFIFLCKISEFKLLNVITGI
jgi:hypothetical protein